MDALGSPNLNGSISFNSKSWSVNNSMSAAEYFWDSTGTAPLVKQRTLRYSDSLRLTKVQVDFSHITVFNGPIRLRFPGFIETSLAMGLEHLQSNSLGWDGLEVIRSILLKHLIQMLCRLFGGNSCLGTSPSRVLNTGP